MSPILWRSARTAANRDDTDLAIAKAQTKRATTVSFAIRLLALTAGIAKAQQTYINPMPKGGFSIHTSGKTYEYVNPNDAGGYSEQTPEGPIYIKPQSGGGYAVTGPGTRTHVAMPSAPQYVPSPTTTRGRKKPTLVMTNGRTKWRPATEEDSQ